jgi:cyclopropane fatty-acyl-phospholipid synthase-like methyltransferase
MGGGVTIEAAMRCNRNVIGYDVDKESYDLVRERLESNPLKLINLKGDNSNGNNKKID